MAIDRLPLSLDTRSGIMQRKPQTHFPYTFGYAIHGDIFTPQAMKPASDTPRQFDILYTVKLSQTLVVYQRDNPVFTISSLYRQSLQALPQNSQGSSLTQIDS